VAVGARSKDSAMATRGLNYTMRDASKRVAHPPGLRPRRTQPPPGEVLRGSPYSLSPMRLVPKGWSQRVSVRPSCGRGDLNPHRHCCPTDFRTSYGFRRRAARRVCGLDYPFAVLPGEVRRCPSSLYTFPRPPRRMRGGPRAWLGIAKREVSPNLSSSASGVSPGAPKSPQVRCVYRFRHARVTDPL